MKAKFSFSTVILALFFLSTNAQVMVKDINPLANSSYPEWIVNVNGIAYFSANDGINDNQLWKSDGTNSGTVIVSNNCKSPANLIDVNGTLFFKAYDVK